MKSHRNMFKWLTLAILLVVFLGFALVSPSASAQEGTHPTSTETPAEIPPDETPLATLTPTSIPESEASPIPFRVQGMDESAPSSTDWSTPLNISVTDFSSTQPGIVVDSNGGIHIVWSERENGGAGEIYYKYWNGVNWSAYINISNSVTYESLNPQVTVDSNGRAHVVWEEQDDDYSFDVEIQYSQCNAGTCTSPVSLSGPPNWDCGYYYPNLQDWHSETPTIGIDQADRLMVVWRAFEPGEITQPYSSWLASGTSPSKPTGCARMVGSSTGSHRVMGGAPGEFALAFETGNSWVYYSKYESGRWDYLSYLAKGGFPDLFWQSTGQAHITWCGSDNQIHYRNSATSVTEVIPDTICNWYAPVAIDADGYPRVFWGQDGYTYESKRLPEGWEAPGNVSQGNGGAYQPDVATDANGNLHMVWYDLRDGNWEIYYSTNALDRIPVIFIPGLTGSRIYVPQSINWLQPDGHGGNYENPYKADEEIWINLLQLSTQHDDYFDILRMEKDGVTQSTGALYGVNLEARDIVGNAGLLDVYNNLLSDLQTVGYQSEIDLFTFPYDWRMDISHNAQLLNNRILEILEIANGTEEQSQWEITQVDLIAHSMGASVAREYISYPVQAARVRRLIAIGPVFLGAPKPLKSILFGDALVPALNPDEAKDIVQNMPGAFQVIPSNAYWEFYDGTPGNPVAFHENRDFDGDNQVLGDLSYNQFKSLLFGLDRDPNIRWDTHGKDINQTVFNIAKDFHSRLDSSWDTGIPVPEVNLIAGTGLCTIGQYQSTWRIKTGPVRIDPIIRVNEVNGDGTVPLFSASLYDAKRGIDHRGGANLYYVAREYANHPFLLAKEPIRQLVINLLQGDDSLPSGIISEADVPGKCLGTVINVESPVELHVTDAGGNHTGLTFSDTDGWAIETGILDSQYEEIEETKLIYLPYDGEYTIFLKATDDGSFNLIIHSYESNGDEKTIVYLRAPLTTTTTGEVVFDTSLTEPPLLRLDHDGDGITDEIIDATSIIDSTEGIDSQPPQIEIISPDQEQVLAGNILVEWQSSDNESGILNEWGYLDMGTPDEQPVSNGAVKMLPYGEHSITVLAEDHLGNATQKQVSFTVYSFEWLSPISGAGTYSAKAGSTIPVKFRVLDLNGVFVHDESVQLSMLDATGNVVIDPFVFAHNPTQGVAIQGNTQYHHNLRTKGLAAGTYTLRVVFNSPQMSGIIELPVILR